MRLKYKDKKEKKITDWFRCRDDNENRYKRLTSD